jgi:general secretion pathway protein F
MQFEIKAYRAQEGVIRLQYEAASLEDATRQAIEKGYRVIAVHRRRQLTAGASFGRKFSVALFSQEVLALLEAGLSLVETLDILSRKSRHPETTRVFETLARHLREGLSFSRALETLPAVFPTLYVATIRTSERTGDLAQALRRYLAYDRQINVLRDKIVSASVYPALLMIAGGLVILFLLGYVVPRFSHIYEDLGGNLPLLSRLLMKWGQLVGEHVTWIAIGAGSAIGTAIYAATRPAVRARAMQTLWKMPAIGEQMRLYQLARFTRTLAMLIQGGIPFVTALDMVGGLLRQPALRRGLTQAITLLREGRSVSDAFAMNGLATEVGIRLLAVGEQSGDLGETLDRIAKLYEDETSRWVDWFSRLFEPILMIGIGLVIGAIVLLMYLPIFELASSIQ